MRIKVPDNAVNSQPFGDWTLYELPQREGDSFLWRKFKLMTTAVPARHGASRAYRLAWNMAELRFAKDRHLVRLEVDQPDLFALVALHMSLNYGPEDTLATPVEIEAELARIKAARLAAKRRRFAGAPARGVRS